MAATVPQTLSVVVALQQAIARHQAGRLQEAGQVGQHVAGLNLKTALAVNPAQGQYSLSYAEALLATGQAREALITSSRPPCSADSIPRRLNRCGKKPRLPC
jgi:thioredoxin-like negative regulator of GroEL